ncbi:hypothetical protein AGRO_3626 [Agrobacterium sp. ATCC 31749]|nr:hypothetical protein AGRO_3626 [Agrobacterium sp. ATCC 31749]
MSLLASGYYGGDGKLSLRQHCANSGHNHSYLLRRDGGFSDLC